VFRERQILCVRWVKSFPTTAALVLRSCEGEKKNLERDEQLDGGKQCSRPCKCMMLVASQAWRTLRNTRKRTDSCRHTFRIVVQILQFLPPSAPSVARSAAMPECTSSSCTATDFSLEFAEAASESVLERLQLVRQRNECQQRGVPRLLCPSSCPASHAAVQLNHASWVWPQACQADHSLTHELTSLCAKVFNECRSSFLFLI